MLFISSAPVLIRHMRHLKSVIFLHRCLISAIQLDKGLFTRGSDFAFRLAQFPKYKNNYILKNGLAYCEIAL